MYIIKGFFSFSTSNNSLYLSWLKSFSQVSGVERLQITTSLPPLGILLLYTLQAAFKLSSLHKQSRSKFSIQLDFLS